MYVLSSVVVFSMTRVHSTKMTLMGQLVIYNTTDSMRLDALKICLFEFIIIILENRARLQSINSK